MILSPALLRGSKLNPMSTSEPAPPRSESKLKGTQVLLVPASEHSPGKLVADPTAALKSVEISITDCCPAQVLKLFPPDD
jgi:hypothetical protein